MTGAACTAAGPLRHNGRRLWPLRHDGRRRWPYGRNLPFRASEQGSSAPLSLMLGLVLIVWPVMLLVLTVPTWEQRATDASDAARNAARALATASGWDAGVAAASGVVLEDASNDGLPSADVSASYSGSLVPGGDVTATVTVAIPVGEVPWLGGVGTVHYSASSTEHVDSFRSGPAQ